MPTSAAPTMSPNDLFAFLSKKEPDTAKQDINLIFGPEQLTAPKDSSGEFARILDIMKRDKTDKKPGGLAGIVAQRGLAPVKSPLEPLSLSDLRTTRVKPQRPQSIFDRMDIVER